MFPHSRALAILAPEAEVRLLAAGTVRAADLRCHSTPRLVRAWQERPSAPWPAG